MTGAKEASTPLTTSTSLTINDGSAAVEGDEFRKTLGPLQYLTITKPDISFVVNKLSQSNITAYVNFEKGPKISKRDFASWGKNLQRS